MMEADKPSGKTLPKGGMIQGRQRRCRASSVHILLGCHATTHDFREEGGEKETLGWETMLVVLALLPPILKAEVVRLPLTLDQNAGG